MNSKGIGIALGVLVVLVALTILAYRPSTNDTPATVSNPWQRLDKARVDRVSIRRPSAPEAEREMDFEKQGGAWRMTRPGVGPTEARALEDLLDRFADMKVTGVAARNATSYEQFEIDDAHATRITLKAGDTTLLDLYVGASLDMGSAVRVPGRTEVFRSDQSVSTMVTRAPRDWRDRDVTRIARDNVRAVEWQNTNGTWRFTRNGDTWTPAQGTTVERLDTAKVNALVDSVTNLRASDFGAANAAHGVTDTSPRVTLETDGDGGPSRVTVRVGANSGDQETFAKREGSDVVFVLSRSQADAVNPTLAAFQAPLPSDGGADAGDATAPAAPPPGAPGLQLPGNIPTPPGSPGIPPEVMEQIRRQIQQQGGAAAPH